MAAMTGQRDQRDKRDNADSVSLATHAGGAGERDGTGQPPLGVSCPSLTSPDVSTLVQRLDLIEGILFEILRQATPAESVPFLAEHLAASEHPRRRRCGCRRAAQPTGCGMNAAQLKSVKIDGRRLITVDSLESLLAEAA